MSNKTIAKFFAFVISIASATAFFSGCSAPLSNRRPVSSSSSYGPPTVTGSIKSVDTTESSGLAASQCQKDVLWTHNDSGDDAFIFAMNSSGDSLGTWKVQGAQNQDWEDIAAYKDAGGNCFLYIGDIGDNKRKRQEHVVYRVREPLAGPATLNSNRKAPLPTEPVEMLRFVYPDYNQDAETLMVHPGTGNIYVVTKRVSGPAGVYRIKPVFDRGDATKAEKITDISVPAIPNGYLTGGDISPDGRRAILCDYTQAYEFTLPDDARDFDKIWGQEPETISLGERKQGEAICYNAGGSAIFATSEGKKAPLIELKRRQ